jgi:hypothetical protein
MWRTKAKRETNSLTGAAILVSRGITILQAAPAGQLARWADNAMVRRETMREPRIK